MLGAHLHTKVLWGSTALDEFIAAGEHRRIPQYDPDASKLVVKH
jgi:hypothetical protein